MSHTRHPLPYKLIYYYSIFLGVVSYRYDPVRDIYRQTRSTQLLAVLANIVAFFVLPWGLWLDFAEMIYMSLNPFMYHVNIAEGLIRLSVILYTILYRFKSEHALLGIVHEFRQFVRESTHPMPRDQQIERSFFQLMNYKFLVTVCYSISEFIYYIPAIISRDAGFYWYIQVFLYMNAKNILPVALFVYYIGMWSFCREFAHMNNHVRALLSQVQRQESQRAIAVELAQFTRTHWRIANMARHLTYIYRFQMLAARISCFASLIVLGYYLWIFVVYQSISLCTIAMNVFTFVTIILELSSVDLICAKNQECCNEMSGILKEFCGLPLLCKDLRNTCCDFALSLSSFVVHIRECGLYIANKQFWFQTMAAIVSYSIVILQFHIIAEAT